MHRHIPAALTLLTITLSTAYAGELAPPAGAPAATMKTLQQVEPRTPISADTTPGDADSKFRITQPGSYYLTEDLVVVNDKHAIEIMSHDVTIDLNGFTIKGANQPTRAAITPGILQLRNITVKNGSIRDFGLAGINLANNDDFERPRVGRIENVTVNNSGVGIGGGSHYIIANCIVSDSAAGIITYGETLIQDCYVDNVEGVGILGFTGPSTVLDCHVDRADVPIKITQGLVDRCNVRLAQGDYAIWIGSSGVVRNCEVIGSAGSGIYVGIYALVENNRVGETRGPAIAVGGHSRVVNNHLAGNSTSYPDTQYGVYADSGNCHLEGNTVRRYDIGFGSPLGGNFIARNVFASCNTTLSLLGTNTYGPVISATGAIATTNPWANFAH